MSPLRISVCCITPACGYVQQGVDTRGSAGAKLQNLTGEVWVTDDWVYPACLETTMWNLLRNLSEKEIDRDHTRIS